jgi:hypothetical protein
MGLLPLTNVGSRQSTDTEVLGFRVVAASCPAANTATFENATNKAALPEGWNHAKVAKNASVFVFTLRTKPGRTPVITCQVLTAARRATVTAISATTFTITTTDLAGVAADADFHVIAISWPNNKVF